MKIDTTVCKAHDNLNEVVCATCKTFMCPECVTDHYGYCSTPSFHHINSYSIIKLVPKLDASAASLSAPAGAAITPTLTKEELVALSTELSGLSKTFVQVAERYAERITKIYTLLNQIKPSTIQIREGANYANNLVKFLEKARSDIKEGIKKKDLNLVGKAQ